MFFLYLLSMIGILFIIFEICVPGFGVFGILGTALFIIPQIIFIVLFDVTITYIITLVTFTVIVAYLSYFFIKKYDLTRFIIHKNENSETETTITLELNEIGKTKTSLKNFGTATFKGTDYEVYSKDGFIDKNKTVKVVSISNNKITVVLYEN